jgi:phosphatidylserine/phosphatidylglycerophosphate/cardiolipin synthase-like enzyme
VVLRIVEHPSWPPSADAVQAGEAQAATEAFAARDTPKRDDDAVPYAPATAADVHLYAEGVNFYPRILEDIRAAHSSVHVLQFGFKPGQVADQFVPLLEEQARAGRDVRVIVDAMGSETSSTSEALVAQLAQAGVQLWEYPGVQHAKVVIADDVTIIGAINLDAWALYRNLELALRFDSPLVADQAQRQFVDDGIAQATPAAKPTGVWNRFRNWAWSRFAYFY